MNNINLISHEECSGCNVCKLSCPVSAIRIVADELGNEYPKVDDALCIECGKCLKVCHINSGKLNGNTSIKCIAAYSNNETIHRESASGGIASTIYYYLNKKGYYFSGVRFEDGFNVKYFIEKDSKLICETANSRYAFSQLTDTPRKIKSLLESKKKIVFVGLPCQVAALKTYLLAYQTNIDDLVSIDLVCHGICPNEYWQEHLNVIKKRHPNITSIYFRDPKYGTENYIFSVYDHTKVVSMNSIEEDLYQYAYHNSITLRPNCYKCKYAKKERYGDITLADFPGLGTESFREYRRYHKLSEQFSCVLINSEKGNKIIRSLVELGLITSFERPLSEVYGFQRQITSPIVEPMARKRFEELYKETHDFEGSVSSLVVGEKANKRVSRIKRLLIKRIPWEIQILIRYKRQVKRRINIE